MNLAITLGLRSAAYVAADTTTHVLLGLSRTWFRQSPCPKMPNLQHPLICCHLQIRVCSKSSTVSKMAIQLQAWLLGDNQYGQSHITHFRCQTCLRLFLSQPSELRRQTIQRKRLLLVLHMVDPTWLMNTLTRCESSQVCLPQLTAHSPFEGLRILHVYESCGMN